MIQCVLLPLQVRSLLGSVVPENYRIPWGPDPLIAWLFHYRIPWGPDPLIAWLFHYRIPWGPDPLIAWLFHYRIPWGPDPLLAWLFHYRIPWGPDPLIAWLFHWLTAWLLSRTDWELDWLTDCQSDIDSYPGWSVIRVVNQGVGQVTRWTAPRRPPV